MKNICRLTFTLFISLVARLYSTAQTTPPAQSLQYNQAFAILSTSTVYPAGWQGWSLGSAASSLFRTTAPTGNSSMIASSTAATTTAGIHNYNGKIGILTGPTADPSLGLAISTSSKFNVQVRFDAMTIRNPFDGVANTMINGLDLQYRVGSIAGEWTTATGMATGFYVNNMTLQTGAVTTPQNTIAQIINLPTACDNQSAVYLRWVVRDISGSGNRPSFAIDNVVICPIATPDITITGPNASCSAQTMHYVASPVNGGTPPSYSWKKNGTTVGTNSQNFSISGLVAGDQISCVLTSNQGCLTSTTVTSNIITIVNASAPIINSATVTNTCAGTSTGAINLSVSGGTEPYNIAWDTSNTNGNVFVVTVGSETVANPNPPGIGLSFYVNGTETKEIFLTKGLPYAFSVTGGHPFHLATQNIGALGTPNIVTNGQTGAPTGGGTVNFRTNGLHPSQIYYPCAAHINMGWNINIGNGLNVEDPSGLKSGMYTVLVTDANGCTATTQSTVNSNSNPTPTITGSTSFCAGGSTILDAGAGFTNYSWSTGASTQTLSVNTAGTFMVTVTNGNGCTGSASKTTTINSNPTPSITATLAICPGGTNLLDAGSGYSFYSWSTGANTQTINVNIPATYTVTVTDGNGCTASTQYTLNNVISTLSLSATITEPTCVSSNDGAIDLSVSGGSGPYTICWDTINTENGNDFGVTFGPKTAAHPLFGQGSAFGYIVNGVEGKELNLTRGIQYDFSVMTTNHPFRITTDLEGGSTNNVVINGQSGAPAQNGLVTFQPDNTHPSLLYYSCEFHLYMGYNVNINDGYCTEDLSNRGAGIYTVIVTDANGCTAVAEYTVTDPAPLILSTIINNPSCISSKDGEIDLTVSGGTGPYTICWDTLNTDNGNQFAVTFGAKTAAHPLFGQGSSFGYIVNGVEGKELSLTRGIQYDFNLMLTNHPFRITTDLAGGTANNVVTNGQTGAPAQSGTVSFIPDNTHPSLLYYSCEFHQFMGYNVNIVDGYCQEDLANRGAGIYTVIVTDANGCTATAQYTVNDPAPISLSAVITDESCDSKNGSIDLTVSGGTGPYTICWDTLNIDNGNQFAVTFGAKTAAHPLFGQGSAFGYIVNGVEGKELSLTKSISYDFNLMLTNHPFRITTDLAGGTANNVVINGQTGAPAQSGTVSFIPDNTHPSLLYYSCEFHQFMGYNVNIVDGYCLEDLANRDAGIYMAVVTDANGCSTTASYVINSVPVVSEICSNGIDDDCNGTADDGCPVNLNLKMFFEGYYIGNGQLQPVLFNSLLTNDLSLCDTIIVELHDAISPYGTVESVKILLETNGNTDAVFPYSIFGNSYYIVIRHRNTTETWSKNPLLFDSLNKSYDFTK